MNIVYAFVGPLPPYSVDTVHQTRLFFDGPIYFIVSDMESPHVETLRTRYNVTIIPYLEVKDNSFYEEVVNPNTNKFCIVPTLVGRERLFIYSFERFFLLYNLMKQRSLTNVLFMELDNLLYDTPLKWLPSMEKSEMAYMFDNVNRGSSGIAYIQSTPILDLFLQECRTYIRICTDFMTEMTVLYTFWEKNKERVQWLPVLWPDASQPAQMNATFPLYNTIFDAASLGIYLGGMDPHHTNGVIVKGLRGKWSYHDYAQYTYRWIKDDAQRLIPFIQNPVTNEWFRINNLHIHSKDLRPCLSLPL